MAGRRLITIHGDAKLTRMLNELGKKAKPIATKALRKGSKLVLEYAKHRAPVQSGDYRRSLTVRALKRSRKQFGFRVTQRELKQRDGQKRKVFYGAFLELGYTARGPKRKDGSTGGRKIQGRWLMRTAGIAREAEAVGIYVAEVRRLVEQEAR